MKSIIIIPTYNENSNIRDVVEGILDLKLNLSILIVDNNSTDGTGQTAEQLANRYRETVVLHLKQRIGLGKSIIEGFKYALSRGFDYILTMDGDLSHRPRYISELIANMDKYDIVLGSRYIEGGEVVNWRMNRRLLSKGANLIVKNMLRLKINDFTTGFRCYKRRALESIDLDGIFSDGYSFQIELLYKCQKQGYSIGEVPIVFAGRTKGKSKFSGVEVLKAIWTILKLMEIIKR